MNGPNVLYLDRKFFSILQGKEELVSPLDAKLGKVRYIYITGEKKHVHCTYMFYFFFENVLQIKIQYIS